MTPEEIARKARELYDKSKEDYPLAPLIYWLAAALNAKGNQFGPGGKVVCTRKMVDAGVKAYRIPMYGTGEEQDKDQREIVLEIYKAMRDADEK